MNKNIVLGGVAGGLVGVAAALLLAPKPGSQLIKDVYKPLGPVISSLFSQAKKVRPKGATKHASSSIHSRVKKEKPAAREAARKETSKVKKESAEATKKGNSVKRAVTKKVSSTPHAHRHEEGTK